MNPSTSDHRSPEQIQHDMERTRQCIDQSVERLEAKLTPERLISSAERWLTAGRVDQVGPLKDHVAAFVRGYPLPSALIGAACAWVVLDRVMARSGATPGVGGATHGYGMGGQTISRATNAVTSGVHAVGEAAKTVAGAVKHTGEAVACAVGSAASGVGHAAHSATDATIYGVGQGAHAVGGAASHTAHAVGSAAHAVGSGVSHATHAVGAAASNLGHTVSHTASKVGHATSQAAGNIGHTVAQGAKASRQCAVSTYQDYPLGVGLVAAGVGLAAGLLIPHTPVEDRILGDRSDKLRDEAARVGSQVKKQVMDAASEVKEAGQKAIREIKSDVKAELKGDAAESREPQPSLEL